MSGTPRASAPRTARASDLRVRAVVYSKAPSPAPLPATDYPRELLVSTRAPLRARSIESSKLGRREHRTHWVCSLATAFRAPTRVRQPPPCFRKLNGTLM